MRKARITYREHPDEEAKDVVIEDVNDIATNDAGNVFLLRSSRTGSRAAIPVELVVMAELFDED